MNASNRNWRSYEEVATHLLNEFACSSGWVMSKESRWFPAFRSRYPQLPRLLPKRECRPDDVWYEPRSVAPFAVTFGSAGRARYTLAPMLNVGWRTVESTPAERAVLAAHGITQTD